MKFASGKVVALSLATSLMVGSYTFAQQQEQQADRAAAPATQPSLKLPDGVAARELEDAHDLREVLAEATEAAVTKDGIGDLVERLNDQDRNRLGKREGLMDDAPAKLNGRIAQLQKAFQDKYGKEFDIEDIDATYSTVRLLQGEVTDGTVAIRNWPAPATASQQGTRSPEDAAVPAGFERPSTPVSEGPIEQANLEKGRDVGMAQLPGMANLPPLTVSFVGEVQAWKIDVPNGMDAGELYQGLLNHLTYLGEHVDQWPADAQAAQRLFTHHVMMALYDVPVSQGSK